MGLVKSMFYEDQQRGWSEIDDMYVCADCIYESFLQTIILDNLCSTTCCYCSASDVSPIAAPVRILQESLYGAVHTYFAEPTGAGVPYDGGFIIEPKYIDEVLGDLGFDCDIGLWDDLVNADAGNGYVNACNGHWATSHENERLSDSWSYFEDTVKHRTRFNFASLDGDEYMGSQAPSVRIDVASLVTLS